MYSPLSPLIGPGLMVAVKARMAPQASDRALTKARNAVGAAFRARFAAVHRLFFEPDFTD